MDRSDISHPAVSNNLRAGFCGGNFGAPRFGEMIRLPFAPSAESNFDDIQQEFQLIPKSQL
jgi:hypothetical protein